MTQGSRELTGSPTNVAVSGKFESDGPRGRYFGGEDRHRAAASRAAPQGTAHPAGVDPDRCLSLDRDLEEHVVAAGDRAATAHPGAAAGALPRLSGAVG